MRKFFKYYILTVRKELGVLFVIAVIFIFLMDLVLEQIPAPNNFFLACGNLFYGLSMAYIASFVFYFIDIHYKKQREKQVLYGYIGHYLKLIIDDGKSIYNDMALKLGMDIKFDLMTEDDIQTICAQTNPKADSTVMEWSGKSYLKWIEYLEGKRIRKDEFIQKIQMQMQYLDIDLVDILTQYADCEIYSDLNIMLRLYRENHLGNDDFLHGVEKGFIKYIKLIRKTETYYKKEFEYYQISH